MRIWQALWPLLAAHILLELTFARRSPDALPSGPPGDANHVQANADCGRRLRQSRNAAGAEPYDTGADLRGSLRADLRPPTELLSSGTSRLVAFLIRNRGRIDNEVVRARWDQLDRISLPLAIHLRQIEADGAWDVVEREIAIMPPAALPAKGPIRSIHHLRILALLPEWVVRGESLLARLEAEAEPNHALAFTVDEDPKEPSPAL